MTTNETQVRGLPLAKAADEFALTTVVLFLAVTIIRWLRDPGSALYIANLDVALVVIGVLSGAILTGLIFSPLGKRSGGHMNPAVTVTLWLLKAFPGRSVAPYVVAQLAGSAAGTVLARLAWGHTVSLSSVNYAAIRPALTWQPTAVFLAEAGAMFILMLVVGYFLAHARFTRLLPYTIGLYVGLTIALLGPRSGGSINPARQLGPAVLSGQTTDLWIYLVAPILGSVLGALLYRLLARPSHPLLVRRNHPMAGRLSHPMPVRRSQHRLVRRSRPVSDAPRAVSDAPQAVSDAPRAVDAARRLATIQAGARPPIRPIQRPAGTSIPVRPPRALTTSHR
jgi:glycerol uptake facilitator-like aquaporin